MATPDHCPTPAFAPGDEAFGFEFTHVRPVPELRATAHVARHLATGAEFLHLHAGDRENVYAIAFRTPPADSTGVAHILEHSVLAGSQRYPVKDAFNELSKGSLSTFLNAFTMADATIYPVASVVDADFYNLAAVYTDLVLRPLLTRKAFMQEGHHLEVGADDRLAISGIVYNEMKGAFATAERVAESTTLRSLLPDTPYGVESGGHPDAIPDLTYEAFREFHRRFYSASNARFFFYGDIATPEHLRFLSAQLQGFERVETASSVPLQPRWATPRRVSATFPVEPEEPVARKAIVNVAWLTSRVTDADTVLALEVLGEAIIGHAAAPLRKALIASGLGEDLSPSSGLDAWINEVPFTVGLRGTDAAHADAIEKLILDTLERLASDGLDPDLVAAAFHTVTLRGLEFSSGGYPFGVKLLLRALGSWLHDGDPLAPLSFATRIEALRRQWEADPRLPSAAIRRWLLDNPHRLRATIEPSPTLTAESERRVRERLDRVQSSMSARDLDGVRGDTEELLRAQRAPDPPEALASLPVLRLEEIPREVETVPTAGRRENGVEVLEHDLFANGIVYLDVAFDVSDVPEDLQPYLPLLGATASGMGAAGMDYPAFATRKALLTGGVTTRLDAWPRVGAPGAVQLFTLRSSALHRNAASMVDVVRDILVAGDLSDRDRLRDVLNESRNMLKQQVTPNGHAFSLRRAAAGLSIWGHRNETWHGTTQVRFQDARVKRFDLEADATVDRIARLRDHVFRRASALINVTGDADALASLRAPIAELVEALPAGGALRDIAQPTLRRRDVGVVVAGEVCYAARVVPAPGHGDPAAPALAVLASYLRSEILYQKIRVEGGAYGGFALYDPVSRSFALVSYRDPNLTRTLDVYDRAVELFLTEDLDADRLRQTVIGTVARLERPTDPPSRGFAALRRDRTGLSDAGRREFRRRVLGANLDALRNVAREVVERELRSAPQAVLAPREWIEGANRELTRPFEIESLEA